MTHPNSYTAKGWIVATLIVLFLSMSAVAGATSTATTANLPLTPSFQVSWNKAKASFRQCHYPSAENRYNAIKAYGIKLEDPPTRYKFLDGVATAAYMAGDKRAAKSYALVAEDLWKQMSLSQQGAVQRQAGDIEDITVGLFTYGCS